MIKFKYKKDIKLYPFVSIQLQMIFADMASYVYEKYGTILTVTQTITTEEEDKKIGRLSSAHREGRAIDIRTKDLDAKIIKDMIYYINNNWKYKRYQYISKSGVKRLAYFHHGTNQHIHLSVHPNFKPRKNLMA